MSPRRAAFLAGRREWRERIRSRTFRVSLLIQVVIVLVVVVVAAVSGGGESTYDVGLAGPQAGSLERALVNDPGGEDVTVETETVAGAREAHERVEDGSLDAAVIGDALLAGQGADDQLLILLQATAGRLASERELRAQGLAPAEIERALDPAPLRVESVGEDGESGTGIAFVGSLLLYLAILGFGFAVTSSVVEEKSSRVVELILAAIRPSELLAGKVVGIGLLGLVQLAVTAGVGVAAALLSGQIELPSSTPQTVLLVLLYFVLGYALYACAFAVAGAIVSRQEDVSSVTTPLTIVLVVGYLASFSVSDDPGGAVALAGTFLPPFAPLIVPVRAAMGELPLWELILSVALMLTFTAGLIALAGRIYERAVLRVGAPMKLLEGLSLARSRG